MRCRFFEPEDGEEETGVYLQQVKRIDEFWREFERVSTQRDVTWVARMRARLTELAPGLGIELRAGHPNTFYVLPVAGAELTPLAELFIERAPKLTNWAFSVFREGVQLSDALAVTQRDTGWDFRTARARVGVGRGHGLEIVLGSEHVVHPEDDAALEAAHGLLASLLGDRVLQRWVCAVSLVRQPRQSPLHVLGSDSQRLPLSLAELVPSVHAAVRGVSSGLPEQPCHTHCEVADWVLFELGEADLAEAPVSDAVVVQPAAAAYGDMPLPDVFVASSMRPEMFKWFLEGGEFASERFSRCGERFCVLTLTLHGSLEERVQQRLELEEAIDRWLVPGRLGCVVGTGAGRVHQYIQLALTDVAAAYRHLKQRFAQTHCPGPVRLSFCDSEWKHEWLRIA